MEAAACSLLTSLELSGCWFKARCSRLGARLGRISKSLVCTAVVSVSGVANAESGGTIVRSNKGRPRWRKRGRGRGQEAVAPQVLAWLKEGIADMVAEIVEQEKLGHEEGIRKRMVVCEEFMQLVQPFLDKHQVPAGFEEEAEAVRWHYFTLFTSFQAELRRKLEVLHQDNVEKGWDASIAWGLLRKVNQNPEHVDMLKKRLESTASKLSAKTVTSIQNKVEAFVDRNLELLELEREAELAAQQALNGNSTSPVEDEAEFVPQKECLALNNLVAVSFFQALGGVDVLTFRSKHAKQLPPVNLLPGDNVSVTVLNEQGVPKECMRGSVNKLSEDGESIDVGLPGRVWKNLRDHSVKIEKIFDLANATTYERNCEALKRLKELGVSRKNPAAAAVAVLFGEGDEDVKNLAKVDAPRIEFTDDLFDESQRTGIEMGLAINRPVVIIQGPPGTGKTSVVSELITRAVARGDKVLATAPTNAAVDNLVERLSSAGVKVVRIGNPVRMATSVFSSSLTSIVSSEMTEAKRNLAAKKLELRQAAAAAAAEGRDNPGDPEVLVKLRNQMKKQIKSLKLKEIAITNSTLASAQVILATNIGAADPVLSKLPTFDMCVVDEAGQAIEAACWIPILRSKRVVLVGDICQLSPTIFSKEALAHGLGISLMERASIMYQGALSTMLQIQYRMNEAIASWTSAEMYGGLVRSATAVSSHLLCELPDVQETWRTQTPMLLLDTRQGYGSLAAGCAECKDYLGTGSYFNDGEADIVVQHVRALVDAGVPPAFIAVQSPYVAQVHLLRVKLDLACLGNDIQVESIDSFQGREAEAVVISMVRSNDMGSVGFLADRRRINVAVTRARRHVAIVCDSSTLCTNQFLLRLLRHIRSHGQIQSVDPSSPV